jgi:ATPases involved in chromosome partitioning
MSVDMLTDVKAIIWRGPLVSSAIKQMYNDTNWGNLDILLLDLPPGTSDAPITVFQSIPVDGDFSCDYTAEFVEYCGQKNNINGKKPEYPSYRTDREHELFYLQQMRRDK